MADFSQTIALILEQIVKNPGAFKSVSDELDGVQKSAEKTSNSTDKAGSSIEGASEASQGASSSFGALAESLGPVGAGFAVIAGAVLAYFGSLAKLAGGTAEYIKQQSDVQASTKASSEFIAALTIGLERNGGTASDITDAYLQLGQTIDGAVADPAGEAAKKFDALGISLLDSSGKAKSAEQVLKDIDKAAQGAGLSTQDLNTLAGILGDQAAKQLLPLVGTFSTLQEEARNSGLVVDEQSKKLAASFNASIGQIETLLQGFGNQLGEELLPAFTELAAGAKQAFTELFANQDFRDGLQVILDLSKEFITGVGPIFVNAIKDIAIFFGKVAITAGVVKQKFDELIGAFGGFNKSAQDSKQSQEELSKSQIAGADAAKKQEQQTNALIGAIKSLSTAQKAAADLEKALLDLRTNELKAARNAGILSAKEEAEIESEYRQQAAQTAVDNAKKILQATIKAGQDETVAKTNYLNAFNNLEKIKSEDRIKIQEAELVARTRIINQTLERVTTALAQQFAAIDREVQQEHESFVKGEQDKQKLIAQSFTLRKAVLEQEFALAKGNATKEQEIKDQLFALEQARQRQAVTDFANLEKAKTDDAAREIAKRNALTVDSQEKEIKNEQEVIRRFSSDRETAIRKVIQLRQELLATEISAAQRELDLAISLNKPASERIALQTKLNGLRDQEDQLTFALNGRYEKLNDSTRQLIDNIGQAVDRQNELTNATEQTNAAANQTSRSVNDLYKGVGVLQGQFHDTGASLVSDVVEQGKAGIAALAQAEAQAVAQQRAYLQQAYNAIQAAYREAEQSRVDANETANEQLLDAQKTYDEKIRKLREDFVKFHKDTEKQIAANIFEGLILIAEETSRNEQNRTAIVKEESDRRKEIETRNANEIFNIIQSVNEKLTDQQEQAGRKAFEAKSSFLDKIAQLENEQRDASTQKEKDAIQKRIDAANAEEQQRLDREARKKAALSALDDEFAAKSKGVTDPEELKKLQAEYEARKKSTEDKFDLEESFQEEYNKLVESGNQKRADELKADYERQKSELDTFLQKQLDNIAANYKHQQELAEAQRIAEETAYQKKLADEQTRHDAEVAAIIQRESEKNQKLQEALDDEKRRRKNQRDAIENEYRDSEKRIRETLESSLDKIQDKLTTALDAAVGRIKSFGSAGSSAINGLTSAIDQLIAKAQQAIGLTQKLAGSNNVGGSPFGNNVTSASSNNSASSTNNITNKLGNGFPSTSNLTNSPLSSDDTSGSDSSSTGDSSPNKNKNKGTVKQAGEVERSSKGGVSQADTPGSNDSDQQNDVTSTDTQADGADKDGKKLVKRKTAEQRGIEQGKIKGERNGNPLSTNNQPPNITGQDTPIIEDRNEPFPPPPDLSGGRNKNKGNDSGNTGNRPGGSGNTFNINNEFKYTTNLNGTNITIQDVERAARRIAKELIDAQDREFKAYE